MFLVKWGGNGANERKNLYVYQICDSEKWKIIPYRK